MLPSVMVRMSPAQVPPPPGASCVAGRVSVLQPLLLANGEPYPPIPAVLMEVDVVAGIAAEPPVAGIAGVFVTVIVV